MPYVISIEGGGGFNTNGLSLDEAFDIETETGRSWAHINPMVTGRDCKAILVAFLARSHGPEDAKKRVGTMSVRQVLESVRYVDDDLPEEYENGIPKAGAEPATTGSSGVPAGSAGRPT